MGTNQKMIPICKCIMKYFQKKSFIENNQLKLKTFT